MNASALAPCPTDNFDGFLDSLRQGGAPAGGPGGAYPYPRTQAPNPYGCPSNCIGVHQYGLIAAPTMAGVETNGTILAGNTGSIVVQPQKRNQPRRVFLMDEMATNFIGTDFTIGSEPVFAARVPFALAQWLPNSTCMDFRRIICEVSQFVQLDAKNVSGEAKKFAATVEAYMLA